MSWVYKDYTANEVRDGDPSRHLTVMSHRDKKGKGDNSAMTFTGPTQEAVQDKIDKFWADEAEKAGKRAAGRVKTAATKAQSI